MKTESNRNPENVKRELKKKYPELTDEDLVYKIGEETELLKRLQDKFNMNEHEIRKWLSLMG